MAFGDVLKANLYKLKSCSIKKNAPDTFWKVLRDIAVEEIKANYPFKVDSDTAISVYYDILSENENFIPRYYKEINENKKGSRVVYKGDSDYVN